MALFSQLRAQRDELVESLMSLYFWGDEDREMLDQIALQTEWRGSSFAKAQARLVGDNKWDGCKKLEELVRISRQVAEAERTEVKAAGGVVWS